MMEDGNGGAGGKACAGGGGGSVAAGAGGAGGAAASSGNGRAAANSGAGDAGGAGGGIAPDVFMHPTADVSRDARIGAGTKIWNGAQVRELARIGKSCIISKNAYIDTRAVLGDRVKVQNNVNVYHGVEVEDDVFLGPSMTFTNDMFPRAFNADWKITETRVRRGASIGANATIVCGVTIGEYAMVGAGSVVTRDVAPHELVVGNPARSIGRVCRCGERAPGAGQKCGACGYVMPEAESAAGAGAGAVAEGAGAGGRGRP
jgi:acetyltransferase-like isoleucine patch superfamily enzyme